MVVSIAHNVKRKALIKQLDDGSSDEGLLNPINASRYSLVKSNRVSLAKSKVRGFVIVEKSLMKRW